MTYYRAVPVSVIENMMETEAAKEAHQYLTHAANRPPTEKMFLSIRDYLIARLEVENCQRPGPMESATLTELSHAKTLDGKYVMKASCHKTSKAGPAPIMITDNTMSNLKAYVKYVRPHYAKKNVEEIFITRDSEAFPPGSIGKRISTWWKKATGRDITSTQLRKVGSSETIEEDLETQKAVQAVMTH